MPRPDPALIDAQAVARVARENRVHGVHIASGQMWSRLVWAVVAVLAISVSLLLGIRRVGIVALAIIVWAVHGVRRYWHVRTADPVARWERELREPDDERVW